MLTIVCFEKKNAKTFEDFGNIRKWVFLDGCKNRNNNNQNNAKIKRKGRDITNNSKLGTQNKYELKTLIHEIGKDKTENDKKQNNQSNNNSHNNHTTDRNSRNNRCFSKNKDISIDCGNARGAGGGDGNGGNDDRKNNEKKGHYIDDNTQYINNKSKNHKKNKNKNKYEINDNDNNDKNQPIASQIEGPKTPPPQSVSNKVTTKSNIITSANRNSMYNSSLTINNSGSQNHTHLHLIRRDSGIEEPLKLKTHNFF